MYSLLTVKDETQTRQQTATTYNWSTYYTTRGEERYELCLSNKGLGYSKYMKGADRSRLAAEARLLENKWDKEWKAHQANNTLNQVYETLNRLLTHTLTIDDAIDFESLKVTSTNCTKPLLQEIPEPSFLKPKDFKEWEFENYNITQESVKPYSFITLQRNLILIAGYFIFGPGFIILFLLFLFAKDFKKIFKKNKHPFCMKADYQNYVEKLQSESESIQKKYELARFNAVTLFEDRLIQYNQNIQEEIQKSKELNATVDAFKAAYLSRDKDSIEEYCQMVLNKSSYPGFFPQTFTLKYSAEDRILIVDYDLPDPDSVPKTKTFKHKKTTGENTEVLLKDKEFLALYDSVVYQVVLRTLHELFEADTGEHVDAIALNAMVTSLNKAKGTHNKKCIASIFVKKSEFCQINLKYVDPKECFRDLKGVSSSQLASMTPVAPVVNFATDDKRFVESYSVVTDLADNTNLATMHWEDFEHLVRELFEKKWADKGAEVRVTQASRDGGIDAVIFDPDPLTGGKIVVQAKRYTNTVGVSAVRDLYGTVQHEGANKGILVTTATFGPDAYQFIKGKPLTLISGNELLHLFQEFGYNFRINLKEAKVELGY